MLSSLRCEPCSSKETRRRMSWYDDSSKSLIRSVTTYGFEKNDLNAAIILKKSISVYDDSDYAVTAVGPVGCIKDESVIFVAAMLMAEYGFDADVFDIADCAAEKGYRYWELYGEKFNSYSMNLNEIKNVFSEDYDVQDCETIEEVEELLGNPEPLNVKQILIDNVISMMSTGKKLVPVKDTRLSTVDEILDSIRAGHVVAMRVKDSVYYQEPGRTGHHYIVLAVVDREDAFVVDPNEEHSIIKIKFKQLMNSVIAEEKYIAVWSGKNIVK